jgi:FAD/FMN-containing dehydrogenase
VRKSSLGLLMAASQGSNRPLAFVEDTAVPPARLAEYTARFAEILDENAMTAGFYGTARSAACTSARSST